MRNEWEETSDGITSGRKEFSLRDNENKIRAQIWCDNDGKATWHTFDENGTGGENDISASVDRAKLAVYAAMLRQGWMQIVWADEVKGEKK